MSAAAAPTGVYAVYGLARSGLAACEALRRVWPQAGVMAADDDPAVDAGRLRALGVEVHPDAARLPVEDCSALVKSPGAPPSAPLVQRARAAGVPVWSEVELAARMLENPILGVTGTNGKTTTTQLAGAMLREGGLAVEVAGNVGRPLSDLAGRVDPSAWVACELSSFQLEDIERLRCPIAVLLNVTPDHLDRHGDMESYLDAKLRIFENQREGDVAIVNGDDPLLRSAELPGRGRRVRFTRAQADEIDWAGARLRGDHNLENALAAAAAARAAGVPAESIDRALRSFDPPPHRLQPVASAGGVSFVDDSKATNPEAAMRALSAFPDGVHLILGGSLKGSSFAGLARAVADGPVRRAYLIGQAQESLAQALAEAGAPFERSHTLERALLAAAAAARPGETVLLSPACASFDQFRDYEERGRRFAELAREAAGA